MLLGSNQGGDNIILRMLLMEKMMRWFGPNDPVSLSYIRQAGCTGVVTALHHIPIGEVWSLEEISQRKNQIEQAGMSWTVVESLPVSEDIKKQNGQYQLHIQNYKISLKNLAKSGVKVITYNFMPILDWMRTDPYHERPDGSRTLRFEKAAFAAFDLYLLKRPGAENEYSEDEKADASTKLSSLSEEERISLFNNALLGLPGSNEPFTADAILNALTEYNEIDREKLQDHLFFFLQQVIPVAEESSLKMAIHPDDPPYSILGLPRIVSTEQDAVDIVNGVPSAANGLCFCTGSLGVRPDNNILGMIDRLGPYIHFLHLRNTVRDQQGNFEEAEHLDGDTDMPAVVKAVLNLMLKRNQTIPMRPDHGFQMMSDLHRKSYPGYSAIGRIKALAEIRGLELGLTANQS